MTAHGLYPIRIIPPMFWYLWNLTITPNPVAVVVAVAVAVTMFGHTFDLTEDSIPLSVRQLCWGIMCCWTNHPIDWDGPHRLATIRKLCNVVVGWCDKTAPSKQGTMHKSIAVPILHLIPKQRSYASSLHPTRWLWLVPASRCVICNHGWYPKQ